MNPEDQINAGTWAANLQTEGQVGEILPAVRIGTSEHGAWLYFGSENHLLFAAGGKFEDQGGNTVAMKDAAGRVKAYLAPANDTPEISDPGQFAQGIQTARADIETEEGREFLADLVALYHP